MNVEQLIKNHKNPDLIRNILCDQASRNLKEILRKADKQLAETKKVINKDECVGVLVILNERSDFHDQDFVYQEISRLLHKKDEQGHLERKNIQAVRPSKTKHSPSHMLSSAGASSRYFKMPPFR